MPILPCRRSTFEIATDEGGFCVMYSLLAGLPIRTQGIFPAVRTCIVLLTLLFAFADPPDLPAVEFVDLKDGARTIFYGGKCVVDPRGEFYGWQLAAGDIDGDGYQDLISTDPQAHGPNDTRPSSGVAHIVFGGPRSSIDSLYDLSLEADITFYGARIGDRLGWAVQCADMDGDGYDDVILAANHSDGPDSTRFEAGEIYVFYGRPRHTFATVYDLRRCAPDIRITSVGNASTRHIGGRAFDGPEHDRDAISLGTAVGDLNGDGFADLVFSSASGGGFMASGVVYVVFGRKRCYLPGFIDCDLTTAAVHPDVIIIGGDQGDLFGFVMECADLDGDNLDDLLVTALRGDGKDNLRTTAGEIYGFWGRSTWRSQYDVALGEFDFALEGRSGYLAGYRMTSGDLDGDGLDDLVAGSIVDWDFGQLPDGRGKAGEYRILFGRPRVQWARWSDLKQSTDVLILGADTGDIRPGSGGPFTHMVSISTGNRNADGLDDLFIAAGGGDGPPWELRTQSGEAYLLFGRPRAEWQPFYDLRSDFDFIIYGATGIDQGTYPYPQDALGWANVMADFDGNGKDELFVSALWSDGPDDFCPAAGQVYAIYDPDSVDAILGKPPGPASPAVDLLPNYPNPFNPETTLRFTGAEGSRASLSIFDVFGREVATILSSEVMHCTEREVTWSGKDQTGRSLPSGVYFVRLVVDGAMRSQKITLLK